MHNKGASSWSQVLGGSEQTEACLGLEAVEFNQFAEQDLSY